MATVGRDKLGLVLQTSQRPWRLHGHPLFCAMGSGSHGWKRIWLKLREVTRWESASSNNPGPRDVRSERNKKDRMGGIQTSYLAIGAFKISISLWAILDTKLRNMQCLCCSSISPFQYQCQNSRLCAWGDYCLAGLATRWPLLVLDMPPFTATSSSCYDKAYSF